MKRLFAAALLFFMAGQVVASGPITVTKSSYTKTNDTAVCLSSAAFLMGVNVSATSASGSLTLYNSSWTTSASLIIDSVTLGSVMNYSFDEMAVAGICYTTAANTNGVQILYRR